MTRRFLTASLVVTAVVLSGSQAVAGPYRARTVTATYAAPGGVEGQLFGHYFVDDKVLLGGFVLYPKRGERKVSVTLADVSGQAVPVEVAEDLNGDGVGDVYLSSFCTATRSPLRIRHQGAALVFYVYAGVCSGLPATPTQGSARAIFSR